jgi:aspartate/methionine/tyrosine aminotransferase
MGKPLFFDGTCYDYWKRKISTHLKSMNRKVWEVVKDFAMINPNNPTPREEEKLQYNDIALNTLYDAFDIKVFEKI